MPIMDGFEACKMLRSDKSGFGIKGLLHIDRNELMLPEEEQKEGFDVNQIESESVAVDNRMLIIAISAYVDEDINEKCLLAGFDDVSKFQTNSLPLSQL
jgi:CheY-like chemotaxis protein